MFHCVSYYLSAFGTVCCVTRLSSTLAKLCKSSCHEVASEFFATNAPDKFKTGQTCAKVHATKSRRNFSLTRSTPLVSKLMFWCVLYCLDAFGTVWLPYKTRCRTGRSGAKVRAMKSCQKFSQRTHPIHPIGPLPYVSLHFVLFGCIWDSLLRYSTQFKTGLTCAKVHATKSRRNFSQRTHPIHPIGL